MKQNIYITIENRLIRPAKWERQITFSDWQHHCLLPSVTPSIFSSKPPTANQVKPLKWIHSNLNYPVRTKECLYKKREKNGEKRHSSHVGSGWSTPQHCMRTREWQAGQPKVEPWGYVLRGHLAGVGVFSLLQPPGNSLTWSSGDSRSTFVFSDSK